MKSKIAALIMVLLTALPAFAVEYEKKAVFDENNYVLVAKDQDGVALKAQYCVDGKLYDLEPDQRSQDDFFVNTLSIILYKDKYHLWIITRVGRLLGTALTYDTRTKKVDDIYFGVPGSFSVSPNKEHVAYIRNDSSTKTVSIKQTPVFIDHSIIYPIKDYGYTKRSYMTLLDKSGKMVKIDNYYFAKENGKRVKDILPGDLDLFVYYPINWITTSSMEFVVRSATIKNGQDLKDGSLKYEYKHIRISGIINPGTEEVKRAAYTSISLSDYGQAMKVAEEISEKLH